MIYTMSISSMRKHTELIENSETLLITRSNRPYSEGMVNLGIKHVTELAPSWDLWNSSRSVKDKGEESFDDWYDNKYQPIFIAEMRSPNSLKELVRLSNILNKGKDIVLICFCTKERCHRRLVSEILNKYTGAEVTHL